MRKQLILLGILLFCLSAKAQEGESNFKGKWFVAGQVSGYKTTGDESNTDYTFLPIGGYFISPSVATGFYPYLNTKINSIINKEL